MKIAIIGSTGLIPRMYEHKAEMEAKGHIVTLPVFDKDSDDAARMTGANKGFICQADQVHLIWDGRSSGTILDIGIAIGIGRPIKIIFIEKKTIAEMVIKYAEFYKDENF